MEMLVAWLTSKAAAYVASAVVGSVVVGWILKKIPMEKFQKQFGKFMRGLGVVCTLGLSKWKWTKNIWNKTLEPFFIHFIQDVIIFGINEFIRGLESDNK